MSAVSANVWLAIVLPRLATDRLRRAGRAPDDKPLAVYAKDAGAFVLTGVDCKASALGLKLAMSLADARAIHPNLNAVEAAPDEDARALDAIAAWCERFTPVVVVDAPDGLFLDIAGCAHLFGGEAALRDQIVARLAAQGFAARAALAPTPGAAWALARYGEHKRNSLRQRLHDSSSAECIVMPQSPGMTTESLSQMLSPLPIEALRLDEAAASLLRRLGLKTVGQLYAAPRSAFTARAGERAMLRLDQALGRAPEALTPRRPPPPVFASRRFLEPLVAADHILVVVRDLCAEALVEVERRGAGVRRAGLHLFGVDGRDRVIEIGVSKPERKAQALVRLFREKLALAAENLNAEFGIEAARLDIVALQRIADAPSDLVGETPHASSADVAAMIDLVSARLGARRVLRAKLNDVHAPERAGAWRAALSRVDPKKNPQPIVAAAAVQRRPLTLFDPPQPIEAIATVPDGPPIRFRWRRVLREVTRAEGPERISGDWMGAERTRDYYRVEDAHGRRYWVFRDGFYGEDAGPRWFVHGLFA